MGENEMVIYKNPWRVGNYTGQYLYTQKINKMKILTVFFINMN